MMMMMMSSNLRFLLTSFCSRQFSTSIEANVVCPYAELIKSANQGVDRIKSSLKLQPRSVETHSALQVKPFEDIPGPKGLPLIGSLWEFTKPNGLRFDKLFEVYRQRAEQYGPIFKEKIGHINTVVVSDPQEYLKLIRAESRYPERFPLTPLIQYKKKRNMRLGVVHAHGPEWHEDRMIVAKKTLVPQETDEHVPAFAQVADDLMKLMQQQLQSGEKVLNMTDLVFKWALESLAMFLFGQRIGLLNENSPDNEAAQKFLHHIVGLFECLQELLYSMPIYLLYPNKTWKKFEMHADESVRLAYYFVSKEAQNGEKQKAGSMLHYLLEEQKLPMERAIQLTMDLLMGGIETTSNTILWALYELADNPESQLKCRYEYSDVESSQGNALTVDHFNQLFFNKAVIKESFRLHPVTFATTRILQEPLELCGYSIPAQTHVQGNLYTMNRNPDIFPNPESFLPDRWLQQGMDRENRFLHSLVWGHGPRMCLGRRIAEKEMTIVLAKLLQKFSFQRLSGEAGKVLPVLNTVMNLDRNLCVEVIENTEL